MTYRLRPLEFVSTNFLCIAVGLLSAPVSAGQSHEWSVENIGAPINTAANEAFPAISADGRVMYFSRSSTTGEDGSENADWDIYVTTRSSRNSQWGEPQRLPDHINTDGTEHSVSFSPDGHWMYFSSDTLDTCGELDIFRAYREDVSDELGWGKPENLGCHVNTAYYDVCVIYHQEEDSELANLYFVSNRPGGLGDNDVWTFTYDKRTDAYSEATSIPVLSSPEFEGHFEPTSGYIWAEKEGGLGGGDIWQSKKDANGQWLPPTNLGVSINTEFEEQLPAPFDAGRSMYFPSDRPSGTGGLDIYLARQTD